MRRQIAKRLQIVSRQVKRKLDIIFLSTGLTGVQAQVLFFIYEASKERKVYLKDVVNEFDLRKSTVTEIVHTLEQNDLVEKKSEESDSRMKEIVLTAKAEEKMHYTDIKITQLGDELSRGISDEELDTFFGVLNKISKNSL